MADVEIYDHARHKDIVYDATKTVIHCTKCQSSLVIPAGKYQYMQDIITCPKCGKDFNYSG